MAQDMLMAYKFGWKTSYYQNTYDFKGEEEDVQPAGIKSPIEDVKILQERQNILNKINNNLLTSLSSKLDKLKSLENEILWI